MSISQGGFDRPGLTPADRAAMERLRSFERDSNETQEPRAYVEQYLQPPKVTGWAWNVTGASLDTPNSAASVNSRAATPRGRYVPNMSSVTAPTESTETASSDPAALTAGILVGTEALTGANVPPLTPPRSRPGTGNVTPTSYRQNGGACGTILVARGNENNSTMLSAVRREMDQLESRVTVQITRIRDALQSSMDKMDRLREASFQRLDQKLVSQEAEHAKLDRKLSEMSGGMRGLADEMTFQIRRADGLDARLWEFRHQIEEEVRAKLLELDEHHQTHTSKCRVLLGAGEDLHKSMAQRFSRLEGIVDQLAQTDQDSVNKTLQHLQDRVSAVEVVSHEQSHSRSLPSSPAVDTSDIGEARIWHVEKHLTELSQKLDRVNSHAHGDRGWEARLEEHEVRLDGIRSKLNSQDDHYGSFEDRVRQDWEAKLEQLRKSVHEMSHRHLQTDERTELVSRRVDQFLDEQAIGGAYRPLRLLSPKEGSDAPALPMPPLAEEAATVQQGMAWQLSQINGVMNNIQAHTHAITELRDELAALTVRVPSAEYIEQQTGKLADLAGKLGDVQRDTARRQRMLDGLEDAQEKGYRPDVKHRESEAVQALIERVAQLEVSVSFIKSQVDDLHGNPMVKAAPTKDRGGLPQLMTGGEKTALLTQLQAPDGVRHEIAELFKRVEQSEKDCTTFQDKLKGRLAFMDGILDKVSTDAVGNGGALAAVEAVLQSFPAQTMRLAVLGSSEFPSQGTKLLVETIAKKVGSDLGTQVMLITGGNTGVQELFAKNVGDRMPVVNLVVGGKQSLFGVGQDVKAGDTAEEKSSVLAQLGDAYLTVEGGPETASEAKKAFSRGAPVLPLMATGGASAGMFSFPAAALERPEYATPGQWNFFKNGAVPEEVANAVVAVLRTLLAQRSS